MIAFFSPEAQRSCAVAAVIRRGVSATPVLGPKARRAPAVRRSAIPAERWREVARRAAGGSRSSVASNGKKCRLSIAFRVLSECKQNAGEPRRRGKCVCWFVPGGEGKGRRTRGRRDWARPLGPRIRQSRTTGNGRRTSRGLSATLEEWTAVVRLHHNLVARRASAETVRGGDEENARREAKPDLTAASGRPRRQPARRLSS
jgi:hypothetical protein